MGGGVGKMSKDVGMVIRKSTVVYIHVAPILFGCFFWDSIVTSLKKCSSCNLFLLFSGERRV